MHQAGSAPADCPNCSAELTGRFCSACGQKAGPLNPSVREFLHDLSHELLHFDGKIFRSVRLLLTRPGFLTREQFEGRRARYVSPIRLYLIFSVLYFAIAAVAPSAGFRVTFTPDPEDSPEEIQRGLERQPEAQKAASEALSHWVPRALFVLVPFFAALVALVVRKSGRNYPLHLYFALHVHAALFFAGAVAAAARIKTIPIVTSAVPVLAGIYMMGYFLMAFRRAYDLSRFGASGRAAAVGTVYAVAVLLVLLIIALPVARQVISR